MEFAARLTAVAILADLNSMPKSVAWHIRAHIGERLRWYDVPEEVR